MDHEQPLSSPLSQLPAVCPPTHPEPELGDEFNLSTPERHTPVPFDELPLYIPGMTAAVVGFDGGINLAALDNHREKGLLCILRPYVNMIELDFIELFCRDLDTAVAFHTVTRDQAEKGLQIPLYIPRTRLPDGTVEPVFFRVTRAGGGTDETQRFRLKVDTVAPAGRDPVPSEPWHSNLGAPEPELDFVDEAAAGSGVRVTIPFSPQDIGQPANTYRTVRDRIRLSIGGVILEHRVTEGEAASRDPIDIWVYSGTWSQIGSGNHVVEYEVIDDVGNYSPGWSPARLIEVELDDGAEPLLPECYIFEAPEDILNADEQGGEDATIEVPVSRSDFLIGDLIRVRATGRTAEGVGVITYYDHPVTVTGRNARIPYPFEDFAPLVGGRVQLSYERIRAGVANRRSRSTIVQVIGMPVSIGLPAPRVDEAPDGAILPPESLFVTVRIAAYTGQAPLDRITLVLEGTYANGSRYYREFDDVAGSGNITLRLMNGADGDIARLEGGTLRLYYIVTGDQGPRVSQDLFLEVGLPQASLPEPYVDQAPPPDYVFDPDQSLGDARILVRAHTGILENDTVTLHFEGSAVGGSAPSQDFKVLSQWVGRDLPFTVPRAFVLANLNGSARIYYTLSRENERTRISHVVEMTVGTALSLDVPDVLEATRTGPISAQVNPLHVDQPPQFTIRVRYAPMLATDDITVYLIGKPGFVPPDITPKPGNPSLGYVDFQVSNRSIAAHLGKVLKVGYRVTRKGATTDSKVLELYVQAFDELSPNPLPVPTVNGIAPGGVLDVDTFTGNALVAVPKWPLSESLQRLWLIVRGVGTSDIIIRDGTPITSAEAANGLVDLPILRSYLTYLPYDREITIVCKVGFDRTSSNIAEAVEFKHATYRVRRAIRISGTINVGAGPQHMVISPDNTRVYVTNQIGNSISVINTANHVVVRTITGLNAPEWLAIHPDGSKLYVADTGTRTILVISTTTYAVVATLTGFLHPQGLALNPDGTRLYTTCFSSNRVYIYNTANNERIFSLEIDRPKIPLIDTTNKFYYIGSYVAVHVLNVSNNSKHAEPKGGYKSIRALAFDTHHKKIYAGDLANNRVRITDIQTFTEDGLIANISGPEDISINSSMEEAYITERYTNTLAIIDTGTQTRTHTITGFNIPVGVLAIPGKRFIYVANAGSNTLSIVSI
ncbi:YncE family protein [Pseudomonas lurida]|uniref:YncE family protein n=1 Tax=Pseudomonas lurida TaxID=244566 RepID=UPI001F44B119|nr:YncE family protein [Pseudomonas lurida]MCF5025593.1 beta-propeller fold lactonase family protein [Pseudomonas lurida]